MSNNTNQSLGDFEIELAKLRAKAAAWDRLLGRIKEVDESYYAHARAEGYGKAVIEEMARINKEFRNE